MMISMSPTSRELQRRRILALSMTHSCVLTSNRVYDLFDEKSTTDIHRRERCLQARLALAGPVVRASSIGDFGEGDGYVTMTRRGLWQRPVETLLSWTM